MKVLTSQVSKYLFILPFLVFGIFHFMGADDMAAKMDPPLGKIGIYITGVALIAAAIAVLINKMARLALLLLGVLMLVFVVVIHIPGGEASMGSVLKDLALAGGAWVLADRYE